MDKDPVDELFDEESFAQPSGSKPTEEVTVGKRTFKNIEELKKAYLHLEKGYTQKSQAASRYKQFDEFEAYLNQHPKLRDTLNQSIKAYQNGGQGAPAPQADAPKTDPVAQKLAALEQQWNRFQLEQEANTLRQKYNLDDETMERVYKESADNDGIALEKALRIVRSDEMYKENQAKSQTAAKEHAAKVDNADVGGSDAEPVAPAPRDVSKLGEAEFDAEVGKALESFGVTDS